MIAFDTPAAPVLFAMTAPPDGGGPLWVQLVPFAMILAIFYFVILLPMRRRQKKIQEFQNSLKVGERVITTSGIYGTITKLNERSLQLQIADKVKIEVSRAAIAGYQGQDPVVPDQGSM
ncbi:MAG TPA: preprotein translocase subunit YajC [Vicinamibacterales bacterium]